MAGLPMPRGRLYEIVLISYPAPMSIAGMALISLVLAFQQSAAAESPEAESELLSQQELSALAAELSGREAHDTVAALSEWHRMRGSRQFAQAAQHILKRLKEFGLQDSEIWRFEANGEKHYGTQLSRPAWNAESAELWELDDQGRPARRVASWQENPVSLAQDSVSGEAASALLVDIGAGADARDYEGKPVQGNLVLTSSQPRAVAQEAVGNRGAAGIVSYAQNQASAWWGLDETLVRWGHLDFDSPHETFAFMVSPRQARLWRERLSAGVPIRLRAQVKAGRTPGEYEIPTAVIRGSDPQLAREEIVYSCHLDHQRPGANDNASGCAVILEVARALSALISDGRLAPPRRSLRFVWPPEIEGTLALLNGRRGFAQNALAAIHLDMVGGGLETKASFHITRGPKSLPSFINDVAEAFGHFVNLHSARFADTGKSEFPMHEESGGREPLRADMADFSMGSDHQVYSEGSFRIPSIYLNDWPDRYIHTHRDRPENVDPTKLRRSGFIAAAAGYFLACMDSGDARTVHELLRRNALIRTSEALARLEQVEALEQRNLMRFHFEFENAKKNSLERFVEVPRAVQAESDVFLRGLRQLVNVRIRRAPAPGPRSGFDAGPRGNAVYRRAPQPKGPMTAFGYSYLNHKLRGSGGRMPRILRYSGIWGGGGEYAYEALNLVDGTRSTQQVRDALSAIYGPIPIILVSRYLETLERIGVLEKVR